MIYVLDASAVVDLLVRSDRGQQVHDVLVGDTEAVLVSVAHLDAEVLSALARLHRDDRLAADDVAELVELLGQLTMRRGPISGALLRAAWALRDNIAMRDALYVATAVAMHARLVTTDDRLARAIPYLGADIGME
ncbi:MAG: PIN domain-containing protein [Nitriliruptoraceae bacterium]